MQAALKEANEGRAASEAREVVSQAELVAMRTEIEEVQADIVKNEALAAVLRKAKEELAAANERAATAAAVGAEAAAAAAAGSGDAATLRAALTEDGAEDEEEATRMG